MNGIADKAMVSYFERVNYTCNTGYRMNGSATAMCSAGGTLQIPTCNSNSKCKFNVDYEKLLLCCITVDTVRPRLPGFLAIRKNTIGN